MPLSGMTGYRCTVMASLTLRAGFGVLVEGEQRVHGWGWARLSGVWPMDVG